MCVVWQTQPKQHRLVYQRNLHVLASYDDTNKCHQAKLTLVLACHQNKEWENEIDRERREETKLEQRNIHSIAEVDSLFRNVCVPDQHEL